MGFFEQEILIFFSFKPYRGTKCKVKAMEN